MAITRVNFAPITSGGDNPTAAFQKLDANDVDLDGRVTVAKNAADAATAQILNAGWSTTPQIESNIDASSTSNRSKFYASGVTAGVLPTNAQYGTVLTQKYQSAAYSQLAQSIVGNEMAIRYFNNGSWSAWQRVWHTGNTTVDANSFIKRAS